MVPLQAGDLEPKVQVGWLTGPQAFRLEANMHTGVRIGYP
jgi:hypothetical protein